MARTASQASKLEAKALAMDTKSAGMRFLLDNGYSVVEVMDVYDAPYGFVYGVADRHGVASTAASRRAPRKVATAAKATKARLVQAARTASTKPAPKATITKVAARSTKVSSRKGAEPLSASAKVAARIASAKATRVAAIKPGRPSAARRQANRKARTAIKA